MTFWGWSSGVLRRLYTLEISGPDVSYVGTSSLVEVSLSLFQTEFSHEPRAMLRGVLRNQDGGTCACMCVTGWGPLVLGENPNLMDAVKPCLLPGASLGLLICEMGTWTLRSCSATQRSFL